MSFNIFISLMPDLLFLGPHAPGSLWLFLGPNPLTRALVSVYKQTAVTNKTETTHVVKNLVFPWGEWEERIFFFFFQGVCFFPFYTSDGQACKLRIYLVSLPRVTSFPPPSPLSLPLNLTLPSHPSGRSKLHCRGQVRKWRRVFQQTVKAKVASNHS